MKLKPLHDWAVIVPAPAAERTAGGLFIPDSAKEKPEEGVVESIGPGAFEEEKPGKKKDPNAERKFVPTTVKPGDRVLYERWAGKSHMIGNDERVLVRERDILGLIDRPQLPAATTSTSVTALAERHVSVPTTVKPETSATALEAGAKQVKAKTAKKKAAKKTGKKAAKKTVKKAVKKAVKKSSPKAKSGKTKKAARKKK